MRRLLILQHMQDDPIGFVGEILHEHGIKYDVVQVEKEALPDPQAYAAIIALGGDQHVYEKDLYPYFLEECIFIKAAVEHELPFLGLCLGAQLLAEALGGEVRKHEVTEIGFFNVQLTEAGKTDPFYTGLPGYQTVYHWHEDVFTLPKGATLLATNGQAENQAFRYGKRAYGLQYHIELNPEMVESWVHTPAAKKSIVEAVGEEGYALIVAQEPEYYPIYQRHTRIVVENFLRTSGLI